MTTEAPQTPTSTAQDGSLATAFGGLETSEPLTEAQIEGIARGLLAELSLDEKIGMMHGDTSFFQGMLSMNRSAYYRQPRTTAGAIARLGIPGVRFSDGPRGYHGEGATTFPQGSARGASWDPSLEERVGEVMGREARAHGSNMIGAPCITWRATPRGAERRRATARIRTTSASAALVRGSSIT